ncbi:MAG: deoxyribonuclease V [Acidobacteria bacterium]|nr:deoxyribonuclease V [Acidobacteriota bacterium]
MDIRELHPWNLTPAEAIALQKELKEKLKFRPFKSSPRYIAGVDISANLFSHHVYAAAVVWDREENKVIETAFAEGDALMPYIPGLLSFRESPFILQALKQIKTKVDIVLVDGHGYAHPRRLGIASHIGLFVDVPTIGCAKKKLVGEYTELGNEKGSLSNITDKNEIIGAVFRSRTGVKPIFISPGNNIDLTSSIAVIKQTLLKYRIPEPLREAHRHSNIFRKK